MLAEGVGWKESVVGSSRDSLRKSVASGLLEKPKRTSGSNNGDTCKIIIKNISGCTYIKVKGSLCSRKFSYTSRIFSLDMGFRNYGRRYCTYYPPRKSRQNGRLTRRLSVGSSPILLFTPLEQRLQYCKRWDMISLLHAIGFTFLSKVPQ